jgi:UPF0716 protein FxsA
MPLLVILFIVVPIVELYVIIEVGQAIGVVPTLAILVGDALLGSLLLRQQGRQAWRRFNEALDARRFPAREVADGLMIAVGGTLLLTPGFITDVFGLILLIPPTRAVIRRGLRGVVGRRFRVVSGPAAWGYGRMRGGQRRGDSYGPGPYGPPESGRQPTPGRDFDVEGTAQEVPSEPEPESGDGGRRPLPPP